MHIAPHATQVHVNRQSWSVLIVSTLALAVCFMVWMMFAVIGCAFAAAPAPVGARLARARPDPLVPEGLI